MKKLSYIYGIVLCISVGSIAVFLSSYIPIGAVAISIILGITVGNISKLNKIFDGGISFSEKKLLSLAIALMGVNLDFLILKDIGLKSIILVISALIVTISSSIILGKLFKFDKKFALLLGIGNGVCGSSAIAATEQIIGANEEEVGLSIAIVNFLGTIGIFLIPFIAKFILHFSDINSGLMVGNTLQAVGQVVAAGFSISDSAGQIATIIKMTRILMLLPLVFILIFIFSNKNKYKYKYKNRNGNDKVKKPMVPLFIIGFALFSLLPNFNLIPKEQVKNIANISHYLLVIAMAGVGLKIKFQSIVRDGKSALAIGGLIFLIQIWFSALMIYIFYL